MISSSLIQNLRQQVMQRLPFSGMAVADVDFFIQSSSEVYCAPNEVILSPADGPPACLYLIRQGRVSGKRTAPGLSDTAFELEAGTAAAHFSLYVIITALLRWLMGLPPL